MAIMTAVVGLWSWRGYDRLRKRNSLLTLGGPINCDTTISFSGFHIQNLLWNQCHLMPFKGTQMGEMVLYEHRKCLVLLITISVGWMNASERVCLGIVAHPVSWAPSLPLLLLLTAGAPNCMMVGVWVEGVSPLGVQMNLGSAWSSALGLPDLLTPRLTSQLHLSPGPNT